MYITFGNVHNFGKCTQFFDIYTIFGSVHNFWEMYIIFGNVYNFWKCTQFFRNVHNFWICTYTLFGKCTEFSNLFLFRLQNITSKASEASLAPQASHQPPKAQLTQLANSPNLFSRSQHWVNVKWKKKNMYHRFFNATFKFKCKMSLPKVGIILWVSFSSARCKMHLLALKRASAAALPFFALTSQQQQRVVEEWC